MDEYNTFMYGDTIVENAIWDPLRMDEAIPLEGRTTQRLPTKEYEARLSLQAKLEEIFENVYFQPPENFKMEYPCLVYERQGAYILRASDKAYHRMNRWSLTYITDDPDDLPTSALLSAFDHIAYDRHFVSDGLSHETYSLYY